ncbi:MAG: hypothetical protein ACREQT_12010 [Candidatus Binataceae bacterium]
MRWLARCLLMYVITCAPAVADPPNIPTQITMIRTGWNADSFGIVTVAPTVNPNGCPTSNLGYVTDSSQPGYQTYYAATLLAFAERATVIVVVAEHECLGPFPKLIGIDIVR